MYNDIRKYLLSKKLKTYRADYPNYILDAKDSDNQKRYFRNRAKLFDINDNNELMIKIFNKKKIKNIKNNKDNYTLYYVPLTKSIENWINDLHIETNHRSYYYLRNYIKNKHFYYKGITNDINNIINNCSLCKMKGNIKLKNEPTKQILCNYPRQRYVGDLTDLPYQFRKNNKFKYIFTIIDHFSKMAESFLLIRKTGNNIVDSLKKFIDLYGAPNEFSSDNGREFVNKEVQSFFLNKNINIIKGRPYNPKNQGVVERIHSTNVRHSRISPQC